MKTLKKLKYHRTMIVSIFFGLVIMIGIGFSGKSIAATSTKHPHKINSVKSNTTRLATDPIIIDHNATNASIIPMNWLDQARQLRTFFTHKSIGGNIIDGINDLQSQDPARYSIYVDYGTGNSAGINHYQVGPNGEPLSKIAGFEDLIKNGPAWDTAFMKLCTGDFPPWTEAAPVTVWETYRDILTGLQTDYPDTVFIWWTLPLTTQSDDRGNAEKATYNALVRQYVNQNGGILFDIADIESHDPEGNAVISTAGNEAMYDDYADDEAHLNEMGRQRVANAIWWLLARIAGWGSAEHWISVAIDHDLMSIYPGESTTYDLSVTASAGFTTPITLSLQGAPSEANASFVPNPVVAPAASHLHLNTLPSLIPGAYVMTVKGIAKEITTTSNLTLIVTSPPYFTLSISPMTRIAQPQQIVFYIASIKGVNGFSRPVTLTLENAPTGTNITWITNPVLPNTTTNLYLTPTASTPMGTHRMMVKGASADLTATANLTLDVTLPPSFTLTISPSVQIAQLNEVVSYTTSVKGINDFSEPVTLTVVELPHNVTAIWSTNPIAPDSSSILTLSVPSNPEFGEHLLQVVGTVTPHIAATDFRLIIGYPFEAYLPVTLKSETVKK